MKCALCKDKKCYLEGKNCAGIEGEVFKTLTDEDLKIMRISASIEAEHYMKFTRLEELLEFCRLMGFKRLGIAFCIGLSAEAETLHKILEKEFYVASVCCKVCGIAKEKLGLKKIKSERYEATCNPVGQALILNREKTDLNIIVGLCVGHDILFTKYSKAPVTTFIVKDRVLSHNPVGAIYSNYYRRRFLK